MLQHNNGIMYPIDRRKLALHVYMLHFSLRKTAVILQVSHMTVSRWISTPYRKAYTRKEIPKSDLIIETIKCAIQSNPFITIAQLHNIVQTNFSFSVSKQLLRNSIRNINFTKKKARFFGKPKDLDEKIRKFIEVRNQFVKQGRDFVSLDETSFGRNGKVQYGYSPKGIQLKIQKNVPRMTTTTSIAVVSSTRIIARHEVKGAYNTSLFCTFLESLNLEPKTVILLDNVRFHHSNAAKEIAKLKDWYLLFVPPYSPRFNPIEGVFSIVKRHFYKDNTIEESYNNVKQCHFEAFFKKSFNETT